MSAEVDFVGRGISFPMRVDHKGSLVLTDGVSEIDSAIRMVLSTAPGERVMRPEFGCRIWELLFEPINANTLGLIAEATRDALSQWEPRIVVDDVVVTPSPEPRDGMVEIAISYVLRTTNDRRNLVYPFYVIPGEATE